MSMFGLIGWQTKILGALALLGAIVQFGTAMLDNDPATVPNLQTMIDAALGAGLMGARANKVTSEQAGAVK